MALLAPTQDDPSCPIKGMYRLLDLIMSQGVPSWRLLFYLANDDDGPLPPPSASIAVKLLSLGRSNTKALTFIATKSNHSTLVKAGE
jgi:hypothetical protein